MLVLVVICGFWAVTVADICTPPERFMADAANLNYYGLSKVYYDKSEAFLYVEHPDYSVYFNLRDAIQYNIYPSECNYQDSGRPHFKDLTFNIPDDAEASNTAILENGEVTGYSFQNPSYHYVGVNPDDCIPRFFRFYGPYQNPDLLKFIFFNVKVGADYQPPNVDLTSCSPYGK